MDTKKDIGSQVKTLLEKHTVSPNDSIWLNLEGELKRKKKKRRLFFLWFSSGLAAVILLLGLLFNNNLESNSINNNIINTSVTNDKHKESNISNSKITINNKKGISSEVSVKNSLNKKDINNNKKISAHKKSLSENRNIKQSSEEKITSFKNYSIEKNNDSKTNVLYNLNEIKNDLSEKNVDIRNPKGTSITEVKPNKDFDKTTKKINNNLTEKSTEKKIDSTLAKVGNTETKKKGEGKEGEEEVLNRWSIFPHTSLDFYGSFNESFNKSTTINYGVYLGYLASKDITLRIGVNKLNFKYSQIENNEQYSQEVNYLELPLEVKYKIIDKKINTSILFGFSYLILDDATIITNQNTVSNKSYFEDSNISLNIGLGIQTKLYKRLYFNVEPIFKYHLKPHRDKSGFSVFNVSILTGIEYKF